MILDDFLEKLEGVRQVSPGSYVARCPAHDDRTPSLGVGEGDGRILIRCYAGCSSDDVIAALGLGWREMFTDEYFPAGYDVEVASFYYTNEYQVPLYKVVRYQGKKFKQRRWDVNLGLWLDGLDGVTRVPYRLPQMLQGIREGKTIYLTEGEKDAEALAQDRGQDVISGRFAIPGKVSTCIAGGANGWRPEYPQWFLGCRNLIIVADNDEPGLKFARSVRDSLFRIVPNIWIVRAKVGKDASDHLDAGLAVEEMEVLAA